MIIYKILEALYSAVVAEGGDGDAIWYCKHKTIDELIDKVKAFNYSKELEWEISCANHPDLINFGSGQEWISITTNKEVFDNNPSMFRLEY